MATNWTSCVLKLTKNSVSFVTIITLESLLISNIRLGNVLVARRVQMGFSDPGVN